MRRVIIPVFIFILLTAFGPGYCRADTVAATDTLTVEEAVTLALDNRGDVRLAQLRWDAADITSEMVWENASRIGTSNMDEQIYQTDFALEAARTNYETNREAIRFSVYQKYYAVVTALDSTDAQCLARQQAEEKLAISELRFQLGMDTKLAVYQAQLQVASAQANHAVARQSLDQSYMALMEYVGMDKARRPALVRELTYNPLEIADPETKISEIVNDSPSVWLAKRSLVLQELTRENSESLSGELDNIEHEQSEVAVITTKDAMRQATRNVYYNVLSMQESYAAALEGARTADEALRVAKLLYEAGMGTKLEVTAAEIAAHNAHQTLNSLSYQHAILKMAFEKPWAYGSAN